MVNINKKAKFLSENFTKVYFTKIFLLKKLKQDFLFIIAHFNVKNLADKYDSQCLFRTLSNLSKHFKSNWTSSYFQKSDLSSNFTLQDCIEAIQRPWKTLRPQHLGFGDWLI